MHSQVPFPMLCSSLNTPIPIGVFVFEELPCLGVPYRCRFKMSGRFGRSFSDGDRLYRTRENFAPKSARKPLWPTVVLINLMTLPLLYFFWVQ